MISEINVLDVRSAIRKRPAMYVGDLDNPELPNNLLKESLCVALEEWRPMVEGEAPRSTIVPVEVEFGPELGRVIVRDQGPGLPMAIQKCGRHKAELLLTDLYACRNSKQAETQHLCQLGIVCVNALSSEFNVRTFSEGFEWTQRYEKGAARDTLPSAGTNNEARDRDRLHTRRQHYRVQRVR